jgi:hypothetical protein
MTGSDEAIGGRRGRQALFGPPPIQTGPTGPTGPGEAADPGYGRQALFSAPPRRKWTVVIECARCQSRTPVPLIELGPRLVPSLWLPGRSFSRLLRCPAGGHLAWSRIHWGSALN